MKPPAEDTEFAEDECSELVKAVYGLRHAGACFAALSE